jgi:SAM-dependent methyltransferase
VSKSRPTHYSYSVYADPATAETFDRRRFGGPIGSLIAGEQGRVLANFVGRIQDRTILDVGTGTGRAALLMARGGARVTAVDASVEMLAVAQRHADEERLAIRFLPGDVHRLEFGDREFDVVICLLQSLARHGTHALGARTEPYRVLSDSQIADQLTRSGYRVRSVHRQFVLPITLHKAIGSQRLTKVSRKLSDRLGLLRLFGTPVTVVAERCEF